MTIDTRFPPQPAKMVAPLYPLSGRINFNLIGSTSARHAVSTLTKRVADSFGLESDACFLAASARHALCHFLKWLESVKERQILVAVPAFFCPHTAQEIVLSGAKLRIVDLDETFAVSSDELAALNKDPCDVLIWPDLFVHGKPKKAAIEAAVARGMIVIRDLAQTFPLDYNSLQDERAASIILVSFGYSKPISGIGGGGLVFSDPVLAKQFRSYWYLTPKALPENVAQSLVQHTRIVSETLFRWYAPSLSVAAGLLPPLSLDLKNLLEKTLGSAVPQTPNSYWAQMSAWMAVVALDHWDRMHKLWPVHRNRQLLLIKALGNSQGVVSMSHLQEAEQIGSFAIRVAPSVRHRIASELARRGLQTTWYYYPLGRLSFFRHFISQIAKISDVLSGQVLLLPCHWALSERAMEYQLFAAPEALRCAFKN